MPTLTEIAQEAFDAVAAEIPGVIKSVTVSRVVTGNEYDPETGKYNETSMTTNGRAIAESDTAIEDAFPDLTATPSGVIWFVAELDFAPEENDSFEVNGVKRTVEAVRDILENGELFRVLVN